MRVLRGGVMGCQMDPRLSWTTRIEGFSWCRLRACLEVEEAGGLQKVRSDHSGSPAPRESICLRTRRQHCPVLVFDLNCFGAAGTPQAQGGDTGRVLEGAVAVFRIIELFASAANLGLQPASASYLSVQLLSGLRWSLHY